MTTKTTTSTTPYTLSSVRHSDIGPEGGAFSANLKRDGKIVARVENDGWGGCLRFDWAGKTRAESEAFAVAWEAYAESHPILPLVSLAWGLEITAEKGDTVIGWLMAVADAAAQNKRGFLVYQLPPTEGDGSPSPMDLYTVKVGRKKALIADPRAIEFVRKNHPDAVFPHLGESLLDASAATA